MVKLTVIKKSDPPPGSQDVILDLIYQALPADTLQQIVMRINEARKAGTARYCVSQVSRAISYLRSHAEEYNWTIPHTKRGSGVIKNKYFAAVRNTDGSWHAEPGSMELLHDGNRGTLAEIAAKAENNATAMEFYATQMRSRAVSRLIKRLARDQRHIAEQAKDLYEEIEEGNGTR
jgi:hypothetical protein